MKYYTYRIALLAVTVLLAFSGFSQLIPKVKVPTVKTPTISLPTSGGSKPSSSGGSSSNSPLPGGKDESGLFNKITDDNNAFYHRRTAVENLGKLETELKKPSVDYDFLTKLISDNERTLGFIVKLEPGIDRSAYDARYLPLKARADKEDAIYADVQKLEDQFRNSFNAPTNADMHNPLTFRTDSYGAQNHCYCSSRGQDDKTQDQFEAAKKDYEAKVAQLTGYASEDMKRLFANRVTCNENGNKFAVWAAKENLNKDVIAFSAEKLALTPKAVIERCTAYSEALDRIESDMSFRLDPAAKSALAEGKASTAKTKAAAETYISSGAFQKHLDKVHEEEIAKVFLPKAETKNATMEGQAMAYVKGTEYGEYLANNEKFKVASTLRAVTTSADYYVKKNEFGIPTYQYKEFAVAFKGTDGKCYYSMVYANYTYKGGGVYSTVANWGADTPQEMACANVTK